MEKIKMLGIGAVIVSFVVCIVLAIANGEGWGLDALSDVKLDLSGVDELQYSKNLDIWFMLMLVAFLMIFIKKYEWGVCLAVLLSAATSYIGYLAIHQVWFDDPWNQSLLIGAVICSITVVIAIGVFIGTVKSWQYLFIGAAFALVYVLIEWLVGGGLADLTDDALLVKDDGGSILVHLCAAFFGVGVALGIRDKRAFNVPMYTTTHSVSLVWLASMLLWMLWPSFVTSLIPGDVFQGTITCYMSGIGSLISVFAICMICQSKVNPLVYTYAMLCGPVAIGTPLLMVGPWGGLLIGLLAGAASALSYIYLQPKYCKFEGIMDVMGVQSLHGLGGWIGAIIGTIIMVGSGAGTEYFGIIVMAVITFVIVIVTGAIIGKICALTRGTIEEKDLIDDRFEFIRSDDPTGEVQRL